MMKLTRLLLVTLFWSSAFLALGGSAEAQTQNPTLTWDQPYIGASSGVNAFTYTWKVDTAATVPLTGVTCTIATGSLANCTVPIPASVATTLGQPGTHTIVLTATGGGTSISGDPFTPGTAPGKPTNFKVVITLTVG